MAQRCPTDAPAHTGTAALPWRDGLAYGALAAPLAFVSLPLYVQLPHHYATRTGVPLAALGGVLLAARALDAVADPWLGAWADRRLVQGPAAAWRAAAAGSVLLALGFAALWHPPRGAATGVLAWLFATLVLATLAYSGVTIVHQAWGARWGGPAGWRAQLGAWREGATLLGVLLASALPAVAGVTATSTVLAAGLLLGLLGLRQMPAGRHETAVAGPALPGPETGRPSPWRNPAFRRLLAVYLLNGIAAALPATLLPFYVADRLQAPALQPLLLLAYFGAACLGLPLWVRVVARRGLAPAWRLGMLASMLAFAPTPWLAAGDAAYFLPVCAACGLALGADLALPAALLTGVIHQAGDGRRGEGRYLGWWACATKLNLALAAGLALPLLAAAGYRVGATDSAGLRALAWTYGGLPLLLKGAAAALLARAERRHPSWSLNA